MKTVAMRKAAKAKAKITKGVKGDPPKKKTKPGKSKKKYIGKPELHTTVTYAGRTKHYKKGEAEKTLKDLKSSVKSGKLKKVTRSDGRIDYTATKKKKS